MVYMFKRKLRMSVRTPARPAPRVVYRQAPRREDGNDLLKTAVGGAILIGVLGSIKK